MPHDGFGIFRKELIGLNKRKNIAAFLLSAALLMLFAGCQKSQTESNSPTEAPTEGTQPTQETTEPDDGVKGRTIYWLGDYDLNPAEGRGRSAALAMFETLYGGRVEWIPCDYNDKYAVLESRINSGEPVDMVSFDVYAMPDGVQRGLFAPLDDYIDFKDEIWKDCLNEIDLFSWEGSHYVVPYDVSDTLLLAYSRRICEENELADPLTLYKEGKWDWDAFLGMMQDFLAKNESRTTRYGICGNFGQALMQSTGLTIIESDGRQLLSRIDAPELEAAGVLMEEIRRQELYDATLYRTYPVKGNVLFFGLGERQLGASNAENPDADLMVVPFPKMPGSDTHFLSGSFEAKLLVKGSDKPEAVAAYITCERLARTDEEYTAREKELALEVTQSPSGQVLSTITEEQYDAIAGYKAELPMLYEFGCGMGSTMYGENDYTFAGRGIINNLTDGLLKFNTTWTIMRDRYTHDINDLLGTQEEQPTEPTEQTQ